MVDAWLEAKEVEPTEKINFAEACAWAKEAETASRRAAAIRNRNTDSSRKAITDR
jgi:hypothetical protein